MTVHSKFQPAFMEVTDGETRIYSAIDDNGQLFVTAKSPQDAGYQVAIHAGYAVERMDNQQQLDAVRLALNAKG